MKIIIMFIAWMFLIYATMPLLYSQELNLKELHGNTLNFPNEIYDQFELSLKIHNSHFSDVRLDSILIRDWTGSLDKKYSWEYFQTSNGNKTITSIDQITNGIWCPYYRETRVYDDNGNLLSYLNEMKRDSSYLENYFLFNNEYDPSSNNLISSSKYYWNNNSWEISSNYNFTYDNQNNQILSVQEFCIDSVCNYSERITKNYNNYGNITQETRERFDVYSNKWDWIDRYTCTYDNNDNISSKVNERYYNDKWNYYDRYTYTEDRTIYLYQKYENNQWLNSLRIKYEFDNSGRDTSNLWQDWGNNDWINSRYYTWNYSTDGKEDKRLYYNWSDETWNLIDKTIYEYDENRNLISANYENFNNATYTYTFHLCNQSICYNISGKEIELFYSIHSDVSDGKSLQSNFFLSQNYPNPFNPTTIISYTINKQSYVTLKIFDILGREIETLVDEVKPSGHYKIIFNASSLSSGVYFYSLQSGEFIDTKKLLLLK